MKSLTPQEVNDFGGGVVQSVRALFEKTIEEETRALESTVDRVLVPQPFAAAFKAAAPSSRPAVLIERAYGLAFSSAPPAFFGQYRLNNNNLKTAVKLVGRMLLENRVHELTPGDDKTADLLLQKFIVQGESTSWGILSVERRLQEPTAERTRRAWDALDTAVPANDKEIPIGAVIRSIQAPPFGYDANTLSLLFCAWFGFHRHGMQMTIDGRMTAPSELSKTLGNSPSALIELLGNGSVALRRRDRSAACKEVVAIAERTRHMGARPYSRDEASDAMAKLDTFLEDEGYHGSAERQEAEEARAAIGAAIEVADRYDDTAERLETNASACSDIGRLLTLMRGVSELVPASGVIPQRPRQDAIRDGMKRRLSSLVTELCDENVTLPDLTHYREKRQCLTKAQKALDTHIGLKEQVGTALAALEQARSELDGRQKDRETIAALNEMEPDGTLCQLRSRLERVDKLRCHSDKARELLETKRAAIERAIRREEEFVASLPARFDSLSSAQDALAMGQELTAVASRFAGAPEETIIVSATERCRQVESVFVLLAEVDDRIDRLSDRKEVADLERCLDQLASEGEDALGPQQVARLRQRFDALKAQVKTLEEKASSWLDDCRKRAGQAQDLESLVQKLRNQPEFLPASRHDEWKAILSTVREELDKDYYGRVLHYFRQIDDKAERRRLLGELTSIADTD